MHISHLISTQSKTNEGILCTLALFHLMMLSPKTLHIALSQQSVLLPSLCMLHRRICDEVLTGASDTQVARKYKVGVESNEATIALLITLKEQHA